MEGAAPWEILVRFRMGRRWRRRSRTRGGAGGRPRSPGDGLGARSHGGGVAAEQAKVPRVGAGMTHISPGGWSSAQSVGAGCCRDREGIDPVSRMITRLAADPTY